MYFIDTTYPVFCKTCLCNISWILDSYFCNMNKIRAVFTYALAFRFMFLPCSLCCFIIIFTIILYELLVSIMPKKHLKYLIHGLNRIFISLELYNAIYSSTFWKNCTWRLVLNTILFNNRYTYTHFTHTFQVINKNWHDLVTTLILA